MTPRVDRSRTLRFTFDGRELAGHPGDTLASALLRCGVRVVGRSAYRDRPRGIFAAGVEEPNALVRVHDATGVAPLTTATEVELRDGLRVESRRGRGRIGDAPDRGRWDGRHHHCDLLVVGAGPAGLLAARAAAAAGERVLVAERDVEAGGALLGRAEVVEGRPGDAWLADAVVELERAPDVRLLTRAAVTGLYDDGYALVAQRGEGGGRLWHVRAGRVVLATGAVERPLVFAGNDRPGIMLAGAARAYATRYGALPGREAVVATTDDGAYDVAEELLAHGVAVRALVDARPSAPAGRARRLRALGVEVLDGAAVVDTDAGPDGALTGVHVAGLEPAARAGSGDRDAAGGRAVDPTRPGRAFACDLLAVSGGWAPALELYAGAGGGLRWDPRCAAYLADGSVPRVTAVGAAGGDAGAHAAAPPPAPRAFPPPPGRGWDEHFVDLQRDATVADLRRAVDAGLRSPEHVKRLTTIGTGRDQGRTSNDHARAILAELLGTPMDELPAPRQRPPATPVPFALLAGRARGDLLEPIRVTALHAWHVAAGATFEDVGQWKRPRCYARPGEDLDAATLRECRAVREGVGIMDASTLGKIDVQGPDAGELLDRVYTNLMSTLPVGSCRYGVLCGVDGMVFDDGVVLRLAEDRFVTTTTTGNAAAVLDWLEEWLQTEWPDLRVRLTSVTDHWAAIAVAGPRAREALAPLVAAGVALDADAFPFMTVRETEVAGVRARLARISFSGELAFEVHVPARFARGVWEAIVAAGAPLGITPYGTEAMHVLRAEKGYPIVGQDTDGTVTPQDLGMDWVVSKRKPFFVGRRSQRRPDSVRDDRRQLVALLPVDRGEPLVEGAALLPRPAASRAEGHVTSAYRSAALGRTFGLALLERGRARHGETIHVTTAAGATTLATVADPVLYDPEGRRRDGG